MSVLFSPANRNCNSRCLSISNRYVWDKFRTLARLETKFDGTLTDYLIGYVAMCKSVLGKKISEREQAMVDDLIAVPEERAELVLDRIEMMNTIRDEVILHPELGERLKLCDTALDLPDWWVPGKHDKELLYGAARHGLSRMEYFVLNDPDLSFRDILKRHLTAEPLLDKKAMREFTERKKTWKIPDEVKEETEAVVAVGEEVKEDVKQEGKSKADEYEFKDDEDEAEKPPEKSKKDKRRKSSDKSKASEEEFESKDEDSSPKKSKKEKEKEKEESPKVEDEEMRERRSRRKSTKDASEATRLAIEAEKMAKEMEKKEKKEKKQDKKKDKEKEKEKERDTAAAKEEETKKEEEAKNKEDDFEPEQKVVNFPPSSAKAKKDDEEEVKAKEEEEVKKEEKPAPPPPKRKVQVSIPPPNITMQQMEQERYSVLLCY